jgi:hypothetical protein
VVYHFHRVHILQSATWIIRRDGAGVGSRFIGSDIRFLSLYFSHFEVVISDDGTDGASACRYGIMPRAVRKLVSLVVAQLVRSARLLGL